MNEISKRESSWEICQKLKAKGSEAKSQMQVSLLLARMVTVARMMMAVKILAMGGKGEDGKNALKAERARLALN